jgi:hypothetical protein
MGTLTYNKNLSHLREVSAADMGLSDIAGNVSNKDGSWISVAGYNQVTLLFNFDRVDGSTTNITFKIAVSNDASTEYLLQTAATSSGVATLSDLVYTKATAGADKLFAVDFPMNYEYFKLESINVASGTANDKYSVVAFLGNL